MSITKKLLLAAFLCCLAGEPSMFASSVFAFCTPVASFAGGMGTGTDTCPSSLAAGVGASATVTSVEVYYLADFQFGQTPSNTVTATETPTGTWTGVSPSENCTVTGAGSPTSSSGSPVAGSCTFSGTVTSPGTAFSSQVVLNTAGFTVGVSSVLTGGSVLTASAGNIVEYDYTVPQTGTPEPTALALVGSALIGLGVLGRKRLAR